MFKATAPTVVEHSSPADLKAASLFLQLISQVVLGQAGEGAPRLLQGPAVGLFF